MIITCNKNYKIAFKNINIPDNNILLFDYSLIIPPNIKFKLFVNKSDKTKLLKNDLKYLNLKINLLYNEKFNNDNTNKITNFNYKFDKIKQKNYTQDVIYFKKNEKKNK